MGRLELGSKNLCNRRFLFHSSRKIFPAMPIVEEVLVIILLAALKGARAASFTVLNNCGYSVSPQFLSNAGIAPLATTGFKLLPGTVRVVETPNSWSGRVCGRTGCIFRVDGKSNCSTGDCAGQLQCNVGGGIPPASLAEFTLDPAGLDLYDISLVDDNNLPMLVVTSRSTGAYMATGCVVDINLSCPEELQLYDGLNSRNDNVLPWKSACEAFCNQQYCCSEAYAITFCPTAAMLSQKSSTGTALTTGPMVSAGTSNDEGAASIIIGGSKGISTALSPLPSISTALSSLPIGTSVFINILLILIIYALLT